VICTPKKLSLSLSLCATSHIPTKCVGTMAAAAAQIVEVQTVILKVIMHCEGCAGSVKRAVKRIPGVISYTIDFPAQKVTVTGAVQPNDVFKRVSKSGKLTSFWPEEPKKEEEPKQELKDKKTQDKKEEKAEENPQEKKEEKAAAEEEKKETPEEKREEKKAEEEEVPKAEEKKEEAPKAEENKEEAKEV
jgi:copper chaperone